jgi:hypothetical protein
VRALARSLSASLEDYGDGGLSTASAAECRPSRAAYEARVGPAIQELLALAPRLDSWMRERGPAEHADLACAGDALLAEFERHTDIACTSVEADGNRAEMAAHLPAMSRWVRLVSARAEEADGPGNGEGRRGGPRCVRFADGGRMYLP